MYYPYVEQIFTRRVTYGNISFIKLNSSAALLTTRSLAGLYQFIMQKSSPYVIIKEVVIHNYKKILVIFDMI